MLTPVDIQQKKFKPGLGYEKREVNIFIEELNICYEQLYRTNADLTTKVTVLEDSLKHYKSTEDSLKRALMLAEKTSEESKSSASREARNIEKEAKRRADGIVKNAHEELDQLNKRIEFLKDEYALYKSNFTSLIKEQYKVLKKLDFDPEAIISESQARRNNNKPDVFSDFPDDPQGREQSLLSGSFKNFDSFVNNEDAKISSSSVYTSVLSENENFVDPFKPKEDDKKDYNVFDSKEPKTTRAKKNNDESLKLNNKKK